MRLVTFRAADGAPRPGALVDDRVIDLTAASGGALPSDMVAFIEAGPTALARARDVLHGRPAGLPLSSVTLLAPIPRPRRNVFCLGLNYRAHAAEATQFGVAQKDPEFPIFFTKPPSTVVGPDAAIEVNTNVTREVDWEVELTVVIGPGGSDIARGAALEHVFGYTIANDVSARDLQFRHGGQWFKGKGLDTFCPLGPWIVTADEIPDPSALDVILRVNGVEKQHSNTSKLIFDIPTTIASLSEGLTLEPGDLILTGTPEGVGFARKPPEFLKDGDVVECEVTGIGVLRNPVRTRGGR
ncbi:MAG TPA: fumarylacetoacetate hydrolase family protein [Chloroflexota bacterium]|nr:fumarylacetoacetate hydrolase family protein [Chloroflexota bacterium]